MYFFFLTVYYAYAWSVQGKAFTVFPPDNLYLRTYRTNASFENQLKSNQDMPYRKCN